MKRLQLRALGWHVIQIWECQLKPKSRNETLEGLIRTLNRILLINYGANMYDFENNEIDKAAEDLSIYI